MSPGATSDELAVRAIPRATYRFQFNRNFTLAQAKALVPYLDDLGISHIYASPLFKAVPGSLHGYDICDFQELNPELGTSDDFANLHNELVRHRMGVVLDIVPNHMGIDVRNNHWWRDILTHGPRSPYAGFFDIDWQSTDPRLRGKVALPILTERYHEALLQGAIKLSEADGSVVVQCGEQPLPVSPESMIALQRRAGAMATQSKAEAIHAAVAEINRKPDALDEFLQMQNYLLTFWRNGLSALNYRRFFTITSLAGVRIEDEQVFNEVYALVKEWLKKSWMDGLRIDHVDGLRHPEKFLRRLRHLAPDAWVVVEKVLEPGESLDPHWPVDGTTGYDFLNSLNEVFIDSQAEKTLSDFYKEFTGDALDYPAIVRKKKEMVIRDQFAPETGKLTELLVQISARHWEFRDFTRSELGEAWAELAVCIPVYRTYAGADDEWGLNKCDALIIHTAATAARDHRQDIPAELFDFLENLLLLRHRGDLEDDFVMRFQQLTGPVMAKAVEDTAFYCYPRLAALNEVGGDPVRFGLSLPEFHRQCQSQQDLWPRSMVTTSTHDTKWGGDVRARLALLSEQPQQWIEAVRRWSKMNEQKRSGNWPDRKMEYLLYQALIGAWPLAKDRALAYMEKAAREAKEHTRWRDPAPAYEEALRNFVGGVMEDSNFMADIEKFVARIRDAGWINSLSQTLIKLTATGVPDIYQGAELWDLCLTDPDNRRPVDFALRRQMLNEAMGLGAEEVWRRRESGLPKLWLIWKVLNLRRRHPDIFGAGAKYEAVKASGAKAPHVLAFMRGNAAITVTPLLACALNDDWADTAVELSSGRWNNVLTGLPAKSGLLKESTSAFPVALLLREEPS